MLRLRGLLLVFCFATMVKGESLPSPTKIRVSERTKTSFTITWEQPPSQIYERFTVEISPDIVNKPVSGWLSHTFTGLEPGSQYMVFVQGFTNEGLSSSVLRHRVWTVPDEPTGLQLSAVQEIAISISIMGVKTKFTALVDGMEVQWKDDSQDKVISGYDLQVSPDEGVIVESDDEDFSGTITRIVTGLTPGKEYSITLRTKVGPDYDPIYSNGVTRKLRMPPAVPHSVEIVESDPTSVMLKTHGPIEGIHDDLYFHLTPNHGVLGSPVPDPNFPMFDLYPWQGLRPGTSYSLDVYAVSESVRGYEPKTITFTTAPGPPVKLRVSDFDFNTVTLQWSHPYKFSDFDDVRYRVEFTEVAGGQMLGFPVKNFKLGGQVEVIVRTLVPGTPYEFHVYTVLNGVKGAEPASIVQTTIPRKPRADADFGKERGAYIVFREPQEGNCPSVKVFYSPSLSDTPIRPTYHELGETVSYEEFPIDGRYTIHARCVSQNVEGPELLITPSTADDLIEIDLNPTVRNDPPENTKRRPLPCVSQFSSDKPKPDTIAPDACCNLRPYNSEQKECCGEALLDKGGDRLCCGDNYYNKRFSLCCGADEKFIRSRREGCPAF